MEGIYRRLAHNMAEISAPSRKMHAVCHQLRTRRLQWEYFKHVEKRLTEEVLPHIAALSADNVTAYALSKGEIVHSDTDLVHAAGSLSKVRSNASMAYHYLPSLQSALVQNTTCADFSRLERLDRAFQWFRKAVELPLSLMAGAVALLSATKLIMPGSVVASKLLGPFASERPLTVLVCSMAVLLGFRVANIFFNPDIKRLRTALNDLEQSINDAQRPLKEIIEDTSLFAR